MSGLPHPIVWFDGHLDLAYVALEGRDLTVPLAQATGMPQPPTITLPALREASVTGCFGTIFTAPQEEKLWGYPSSDDLDAAHAAGMRQLDVYRRLDAAGELRIVRSARQLAFTPDQPVEIVLLMEGADPIRSPDEVTTWFDHGLRAVGLAWASGTRYAGGNHNPGPLTPAGIDLVHALDAHRIIHDCSHLPDQAAGQLLENATGPVMASHSNSRAVVGNESQRHLPDEIIIEIARRGGIIGLNLFSQFLIAEKGRRATVEEAVAHVDYICNLVGSTDHVGLGSDMDGGFGADRIPRGIETPSDLVKLALALSARGWSDDHVSAFTHKNWRRFLEANLP